MSEQNDPISLKSISFPDEQTARVVFEIAGAGGEPDEIAESGWCR